MSLIKEFFTQEETEAKNYVCNLCQKTFVALATGTTSHLWTNLYRKHLKAYDRLKHEYADKKRQKSKNGKHPTATSSEADDNKRQCLMSVFMPAKKKLTTWLFLTSWWQTGDCLRRRQGLVFRTYEPLSRTAPTNYPTPLLSHAS